MVDKMTTEQPEFEALAKRWLQTPDPITGQPGWQHAADTVEVIQQIPGQWHQQDRDLMVQTAWLHHIFEQGRKDDGTPVTNQDLTGAGVPNTVIFAVGFLHRPDLEGPYTYHLRVARSQMTPFTVVVVACWVARVKVLDNEGRLDRKTVRFVNDYIIPLVQLVEDEDSTAWLADRFLNR